jgi:anti-sigma regulatory factor (Ser/Thr protein kinase)
MFLPPDMSCIKVFRKAIRKSLEENQFNPDDIVQIELAADEAVTNSISANVDNKSEETIICRWMISDKKITIYILDYGSGFKMNAKKFSPENNEKPSSFAKFLDSVKCHQSSKPETLPFQGVETGHKNVGKGLKIIHTLMDSVKIMFHVDGIVTDVPETGASISGSIVELEYDSKKRAQA